jgi:hypothetical protein
MKKSTISIPFSELLEDFESQIRSDIKQENVTPNDKYEVIRISTEPFPEEAL